MILIGGFVKDIGRGDMTVSLSHFAAGFGVEWGERGLFFDALGGPSIGDEPYKRH